MANVVVNVESDRQPLYPFGIGWDEDIEQYYAKKYKWETEMANKKQGKGLANYTDTKTTFQNNVHKKTSGASTTDTAGGQNWKMGAGKFTAKSPC